MKSHDTEWATHRGCLSAQGRVLGVPTPVNDAVVAEMRLDPLAKLLPR